MGKIEIWKGFLSDKNTLRTRVWICGSPWHQVQHFMRRHFSAAFTWTFCPTTPLWDWDHWKKSKETNSWENASSGEKELLVTPASELMRGSTPWPAGSLGGVWWSVLMDYSSYVTAPLEKKQLIDSLTDMSIDRFGQLIIWHGGVSTFYHGIFLHL